MGRSGGGVYPAHASSLPRFLLLQLPSLSAHPHCLLPDCQGSSGIAIGNRRTDLLLILVEDSHRATRIALPDDPPSSEWTRRESPSMCVRLSPIAPQSPRIEPSLRGSALFIGFASRTHERLHRDPRGVLFHHDGHGEDRVSQYHRAAGAVHLGGTTTALPGVRPAALLHPPILPERQQPAGFPLLPPIHRRTNPESVPDSILQHSQRGKGPPRSHPGAFPPKQNKLPLCRRSYFFASQHHAEILGLTKTELTRKKYLELTDTAAMRSWERFSSSVGIQDQSSYLDLMVSFLQNVNIGLSCHLERRSCRNGSSPSSRQLPSVGRYGWNLLGS